MKKTIIAILLIIIAPIIAKVISDETKSFIEKEPIDYETHMEDVAYDVWVKRYLDIENERQENIKSFSELYHQDLESKILSKSAVNSGNLRDAEFDKNSEYTVKAKMINGKIQGESIQYQQGNVKTGGINLTRIKSLLRIGKIDGLFIENNKMFATVNGGKEDQFTGFENISPDDMITLIKGYFESPDHSIWVTIDPAENESDRFNFGKVRYGGNIQNTHVGAVLFEADRLMKNIGMGYDNRNGKVLNPIQKTLNIFPIKDEPSFVYMCSDEDKIEYEERSERSKEASYDYYRCLEENKLNQRLKIADLNINCNISKWATLNFMPELTKVDLSQIHTKYKSLRTVQWHKTEFDYIEMVNNQNRNSNTEWHRFWFTTEDAVVELDSKNKVARIRGKPLTVKTERMEMVNGKLISSFKQNPNSPADKWVKNFMNYFPVYKNFFPVFEELEILARWASLLIALKESGVIFQNINSKNSTTVMTPIKTAVISAVKERNVVEEKFSGSGIQNQQETIRKILIGGVGFQKVRTYEKDLSIEKKKWLDRYKQGDKTVDRIF